MGQKMRKMGIDLIGDVPWGTHFCQFYQTQQDLIDILVPYFQAGLENNEFCMWVTSEPLSEKEVQKAMRKAVPNFERYLTRGQIEIVPHAQWYLKNGTFDLQRVLKAWIDKLNQALAKGYDGMRVTGNTAWLEKRDWRNFAHYEEEVNRVIGKYRMMDICSYCLDKCSAFELIDVVRNHQFALVRREGEWELIGSFERKWMQEELEREREKTEGYLNIAGIMLAVVNADENITLINKKGCKILGYNEGELIGRNWFDILIPGRIRGEVRGVFRKLMDGNIKLVEHYENPLLTKDGKERLIAFHNTVIRNPNGQIVGVLFSAEDITERKKAEEELEESRSHFQMLFNVMVDPVVIVDEKGEILEITNTVQEITGFKKEELLGKNFMRTNIVTARSKAILIKNLVKRMMGMKIAPYEVEILTKDGKKIPIEVNAVKIDYMRKPADMVVFRDLTERKKVEKRIKEYVQELTVRNEQLKVETEKAKESDRLKSEFLANMSHEIRTPLAAINGAAYLLDKGSLSEEQRKLCSIIGQSGEQLLLIINDILDLALIEAGEVKLEEKEFSLKETLKRIISGFKLKAKEKGLELKMILPSDLPSKILSDEGKLIQIVSNLITNALKFTERGKVEVKVERLADSKIQFHIKDTGIGIAEEKLSHIFNKFYQVDGTMTRKYRGTGLGLTIAKDLVDLLGGEIKVKSILGKGSTFSFSFPCRISKQKVVPHKDLAKLKPKIKKKIKKDISILIAEDDEFGYHIIERFLEGYTISRAKDGKDALEKIEKKSYDLILMDIQMPKMDGLEATRKIREKDSNLPIIALTAKAMKVDEEKCLEAGCNDYISKPIAPDELIAKVNQYAARRPPKKQEAFPK